MRSSFASSCSRTANILCVPHAPGGLQLPNVLARAAMSQSVNGKAGKQDDLVRIGAKCGISP